MSWDVFGLKGSLVCLEALESIRGFLRVAGRTFRSAARMFWGIFFPVTFFKSHFRKMNFRGNGQDETSRRAAKIKRVCTVKSKWDGVQKQQLLTCLGGL